MKSEWMVTSNIINGQEMFGGLPIDSIRTIEKIVKENKNDTSLGYDSRDYVRMFIETFEGKEEKK